MFTKTRILLSLMFLMTCSAVSAQELIERLFRGDRQNTGIDLVQTSDEGYLVLSSGRPLDSTRFEYLTVTKFDNKTNLSWSMDYSFEHKVFPDGSITLLEGDSFVISGVLDTSSINKVLLKADPGGAVVWSRGFGRDDTDVPSLLGDASTDMTYRNGFFLAGDVYGPGLSTDIFLAESDGDGNQLWAKSYSGTSNGFFTTKVRMTQDSGAIMVGNNITFPSSDIFLVKTDSLGNIEWSRNYGESTLVEFGTSVAPTPDGGYLVGGRKINPVLPSHPGVLIKTDTFGTPQWTLNVDFQTSDSILINDIVIDADGNAVVSGSILGAVDNHAFMMKVDLSGTGSVIWKRIYKASTRQFVFSNGLIESPFGGYAYLTSSDEGIGNTQVGPYLIKTDEDGATLCDSVFAGQLIFPTTITVDTLVLTTTEVNDSIAITVVDTLNYSGFNLTTLQLETFGPYCPDAVFSDTLDATTDGAIAYEWSTGETTPTIVVTEFDDYMVTVTIGEDYCYVLCTSSSITALPLPMVDLSFNDDDFCSTGMVTINAGVVNVDDIVWSTSETTGSILVDTEGLYSVTVTNNCDSMTADIMITFDTSPPAVDITGDGTFCATGTEDLTATYAFGDAVSWSTGDPTDVTTVDQLGNYSVTVSSNFCQDGIANYTVESADITVAITDQGSFCSEGEVTLTATPSSPANNFEWSTGEMGPGVDQIVVTAQETFSITVTDFCDSGTSEYMVETGEITGDITSSNSFCSTGEETLIANPSPVANNYEWSTGETTPSINVSEVNTYSVTVSDFCDTQTFEFTVNDVTNLDVSISRDSSFCIDGDEILTAVVTGSTASTYAWSTSDNTPTSTITDQGTFTVTVTDFCGEANAEETILCPIEYDIGNAFTPNGDPFSQIFIPQFSFNPAELVEYEFVVYSRWGKKVFETTNPIEGWDGMVGDKPGVSDVYFFTVKGSNNLGVELSRSEMSNSPENHGDVTLIR